jgi:hypothetical protein
VKEPQEIPVAQWHAPLAFVALPQGFQRQCKKQTFEKYRAIDVGREQLFSE